jgi:transcriptional regulator with XRE-family HTH domain
MAKTIGARLVELLEERGWSQGELARRTGLTRSAISQLVQGATEPSLATIRKLAAALDLAEGDIIDGTEAPARDAPDGDGSTAVDIDDNEPKTASANG